MKAYIKCYAIRHNFPLQQVEGNDLLHHCAILEFQVGTGHLTLEAARYTIVESFPETNSITGMKSVLNLISPYDGCRRELKNTKWEFIYNVN